jgi:hypothetical protein
MRSYCKLSDAELAVKDLARARQYANAALPEGAVQHRVSVDLQLPSAERLTAGSESRRWYLKAAEAWSTWNARGAATPESERERHRVENLLKSSGPVLQLSETGK